MNRLANVPMCENFELGMLRCKKDEGSDDLEQFKHLMY